MTSLSMRGNSTRRRGCSLQVEKPISTSLSSRIFKETAVFSASIYAAQAVFMLRGLLLARLLPPSTYGLWTIFRIIIGSSVYTGIGSANALVRQIPLYMKDAQADQCRTAFLSSLNVSIITSLAISFGIIVLSTTSKVMAPYVLEGSLCGIIFFLSSLHFYILFRLKSENRILFLSAYHLIFAITNATGGLTLLYFLGFKGFLLGLVLSHVVLLAGLQKKGLLPLQWHINKKMFQELFNIGFPMMVITLAFFLIQSLDKIVVFAFLGKTATGYYGLAAFLISMVHYVPHSLGTVLFPKMMSAYGRSSNMADISSYYTVPIGAISGIMPIILGVAYINIEWAVRLFLPNYIPSIPILRILLLGLCFSAMWRIPTDILIANNKHIAIIWAALAVIASGLTVDIVLVNRGIGLSGIAMVSSMMFWCLSVIINLAAMTAIAMPNRARVRLLAQIYFPFVYAITGAAIVRWVPLNGNIYQISGIHSILFLAISTPHLLSISNRYKLVERIRKFA